MQDSQPEQRHDDFVALQETVHSINTTLRQVTKIVLASLVPLMVAGIGTLISNHYQQKALVAEFSQLNSRLTKTADQLERTNEMVIVMWASGDWESKYKTQPRTPGHE